LRGVLERDGLVSELRLRSSGGRSSCSKVGSMGVTRAGSKVCVGLGVDKLSMGEVGGEMWCSGERVRGCEAAAKMGWLVKEDCERLLRDG
jgi:hypothetical protein